MDHFRRHLAAAALVSTLAVGACAAPTPATPGAISCGPATAVVDLAPGLRPDPAPVDASIAAPTTLGCADGTGRGIRSATLESLDLRLHDASCFLDRGMAGTGTAALRTSDGAAATATVDVEFPTWEAPSIHVQVLDGPLAGMSGRGPIGFGGMDGGGSCFDAGVTRFRLELGALTLR